VPHRRERRGRSESRQSANKVIDYRASIREPECVKAG
jgi:hypothetical protein